MKKFVAIASGVLTSMRRTDYILVLIFIFGLLCSYQEMKRYHIEDFNTIIEKQTFIMDKIIELHRGGR